jgi:hypothetical protein
LELIAAAAEWWAYEQTGLNVAAEVMDAYLDSISSKNQCRLRLSAPAVVDLYHVKYKGGKYDARNRVS